MRGAGERLPAAAGAQAMRPLSAGYIRFQHTVPEGCFLWLKSAVEKLRSASGGWTGYSKPAGILSDFGSAGLPSHPGSAPEKV